MQKGSVPTKDNNRRKHFAMDGNVIGDKLGLLGSGAMAMAVVKGVVRALRGDRSTEAKRAGASPRLPARCFLFIRQLPYASPPPHPS